jgi:Mn-dependent DtxR family transcriptional regulator
MKVIGKGMTSGSISRKLSIERKSAEEALVRLRVAGLVGFYSDTNTWFVTLTGQKTLDSAD